MKAIINDFNTEIFPTNEEVKQVCKMGQGAECCVWLLIGARGFECVFMNRPHDLIERINNNSMVAKRNGCEEMNSFNPRESEGTYPIEVNFDLIKKEV
jgi:hypothetical protein